MKNIPSFTPSKITRVTYKKYRDFMNKFDKNGPLRLGQAFCNMFDFQGDESPLFEGSSLFYETNSARALQRIWSDYVGEDNNNGKIGW